MLGLVSPPACPIRAGWIALWAPAGQGRLTLLTSPLLPVNPVSFPL